MKVTTTYVGAHAYTNIKTASVDMDVLLHAGKSTINSLLEISAEIKTDVEKRLKRASLIDEAVEVLKKTEARKKVA
jgi:hypothetical protein